MTQEGQDKLKACIGPETRVSLVNRLRDLEDREVWEEFFQRYWRLIFSVARKAGLNDSEAEDVVQETTLAVAKYIQEFRYNPRECSFKGWLLHKTRWKIIDQVRKRPPGWNRQPREISRDDGAETATVERIADPRSSELDECWEMEWKRSMLETALERVKPRIKAEHFQVFHLSAVRQLGPRQIASLLGLNVAEVYLIRHRVTALVKREIQVLEQLTGGPRAH